MLDRGREFSRLIAIELSAEGKRKGITQKQIAAAMGITPEQVSYYVNGKRGVMTVGSLLLASERLGIDPEVIVDRAYAALGAVAEVVAFPARGDWDPQQRAASHEDVPKDEDF